MARRAKRTLIISVVETSRPGIDFPSSTQALQPVWRVPMGPSGRLAVPFLVCFFFVPSIAAAQAPGGASSVGLVSPGGPGAPTLTTECPTFSWAPGNSASAYELAVFELTSDGQPRAVPNLHVALSGRASSWTPPSTSCLIAGHQYG